MFGVGDRPYRWGPVQELIFLDRYSPKAAREEIQPGDVVVVMTSDDRRYPAKEVGIVEAVEGDEVVVRLKVNGEVIRRPRNRCDKPLETRPEQMWDRLARAAAQVEAEEKRERLTQEFRWLLDGFRFVPGGRINAMLGTGQALTAYNCYVIPVRGRTPDVPRDSRHAIIDTLGNMVEIMARGGGVGINLSVLRPRLAYVKGVNGKSSGSVSWGALFSFATGLVEQGGSRRGALMLILNVWHPDVVEFINAKRDFAAITNANISVGITEEFERALETDGEWELVFPDTTDPDYDRLWDGDLKKWRALGKPVKVYQRLRARDLFRQIVESAWASAEPGFVRLDYANAMSNSWYYAPLISTNPCGEQPLPPWGVCLLGHLNLARFVEDGKVKWEELGRAARLAVRFLDNVIDITPYFFEENERQQKLERRVGMGTMGLGEMLIHLGIRYGSPEAVKFVDELYGFIAREAYLGSVELAKEKGPFPAFDADKFLQSGFMKTMPEDVREAVRRHGIRNVTLMTQAPTGTTGTMAGTSTGIEPYYAWSYYRFGRLGRKEVFEPVVQEYFEAHPELGGDLKKLPPYFVTALELTPEEHVRMQAAIQRWVDSAISKTANLPAHYTVEQTMELYELAIKLGCKGVTIYRDRSRDEQVLVAKDETSPGQQAEVERGAAEAAAPVAAPAQAQAARGWSSPLEVEPRAVIGEVPEEVQGFTYRQKTLVGTARVVINEHPRGQPFETIIVLGKGGMDITADAEAIGRLISLYLRTPSPISNLEKLALVVEQLRNIGGAQPFGFGPDRVLSMPDALAKALERYLRTRRAREEGSARPGQGGGETGSEAESEGEDEGRPVAADGGGRGGSAATAAAGGAAGPTGAAAPVGQRASQGEGRRKGGAAGASLAVSDPAEAEVRAQSSRPTLAAVTEPGKRTNGRVQPLAGADICPVCGQAQYVRMEGCGYCKNCGYTRC